MHHTGTRTSRHTHSRVRLQILINSRGMKMDSFQSLYYVSPACLLCLIIPFFAVELPGVRALLADPVWVFRPGVFLANAMTALALNLAVFLLIGKTSALTMNIAGVIKDWLLIYSSYSVFHAPVTPLNLAGAHLMVLTCSRMVTVAMVTRRFTLSPADRCYRLIAFQQWMRESFT